MKRRRHQIDLLPLLDVFMVVLFVFATVQEQSLAETARELEACDDELRESQSAAADADAIGALQAQLRQRDEALTELRGEAQRTLAGLTAGDAVRRDDVLAKLLDRYSVFEIEIGGALDETGAVVNRCCFRTDPLVPTWQRCGDVPAVGEARAIWLDEAGGGLLDALRRTKGGNAMTIVRQNERASYRIASNLEELLRERFPDHQIYDEGVTLAEIHCGD